MSGILPHQIEPVMDIIAKAEREIQEFSGVPVRLGIEVLAINGKTDEAEKIMEVIAIALGRKMTDYTLRCKKREYVDLRFITAYFLKAHIPNIGLKEIGDLFGGLDHTTIVNALKKVDNLLFSNDRKFMDKFTKALKALTECIKMK